MSSPGVNQVQRGAGGDASSSEPDLREGAISAPRAFLYVIPSLGIGTFIACGGSYFMQAGAGNSAWLSALFRFALFLVLARIISNWAKKPVATGSLMSYIAIEASLWLGLLAGAALLVGYLLAVAATMLNFLYFGMSFLNTFGVPFLGTNGAIVLSGAFTLFLVVLVTRGIDVSVNVTTVLGWLAVPLGVVLLGLMASQRGLERRRS
ncbi:hypothetical protein FZI85_20725 [Mycobacterium sp. CBMA293]|uniref:hypothetical protein n=1 Tax=unclassified Mycolicibacterium TaxID=2636767 RepID=UPI0012DF267D|nr:MULTISPECIES: hypothetical protein [unclassified Mycolicibacterium]MUL49395.1 hypothetical protein [Mycolicibacterium sp. CBMA 360]MUL62571.1 hypothetical protein [Mycolicibacterium sp. CBMA 335]MUL69023.1 hypothetical protein [Mycolicibacterium sp. CBMA 311]MUL96962.1 hypothetical protein [Mycolicibacterium sp. CBMA 230]MUM13433.1 hypothetical protein [Mycolicibacterium sp. CBMA 293]